MKRTIFLFTATIAFFSCRYEPLPDVPKTLVEPIFVERQADGNYLLQGLDTTAYRIFVGHTPNTIEWSREVELTDGIALNSDPHRRLYLALIGEQDTLILSERRLPLQGADNFRDIGGIPTQSGRKVAWGKIYRSDDLSELSEDDLDYLASIGLHHIFDLRSDIEISEAPDKYPRSTSYAQMALGDKEGKSIEEFKTIVKTAKPGEINTDSLMEAMNHDFVVNTHQLKPLFDSLLYGKGEPILLHCTAGKDRTGYTTALILAALGVDETTIMNEYLMSAYYIKDGSNSMLRKAAIFGISPEVLKPFLTVKPTFLQAALDDIHKAYGSVDKLLENELGINDSLRSVLIHKYTY